MLIGGWSNSISVTAPRVRTCSRSSATDVAPGRAVARLRPRARPRARARRAASGEQVDGGDARRAGPRPDRPPTCGRAGADRGAPPSPRAPRRPDRTRDGRWRRMRRRAAPRADRGRDDAGVGEHPRRVPVDEEVGARDQRGHAVAVGGRAEVERRRPPDRRRGRRASGNGIGTARMLDLHDARAEAGEHRPTSGVAHAVPSSDHRCAPAIDGSAQLGHAGRARAGRRRTAAAGSIHAAASASIACRWQRIRRAYAATGAPSAVTMSMNDAQAVGGPGCTQPSAVRSSGGAHRPRDAAPRRAHREVGAGPGLDRECVQPETRRERRRARGARARRRRRARSRSLIMASSAGEARRSLLEERGDAFGAIVGGGDQEVEVGLEPQRVGEGEVAAALHRVAGRRLRTRRAVRQLRRRAPRRGHRDRRRAPPARCARARRRRPGRRPRACAAPAPRRRRG